MTEMIAIDDPTELEAAKLDARPTLFRRFPMPLPPELFTYPALESLITAMHAGGGRDVRCRASAETPADPSMNGVKGTDFAGRLEPRLRHEGMHIMLTNVERYEGGYRPLLERFVTLVRPAFTRAELGVFQPSVTLFLSSPRSVARFHNDVEHGFLHQIAGTKTLHVYPFVEEKYSPPGEPLERRQSRSREATDAYMREFEDRAYRYDLRPGNVVHLPALMPHWVEAGGEVAVSLTFLLFSREGDRRRRVEIVNEMLERRGLHPRGYNRSRPVDSLKCVAHDVLTRLHLMKGSWSG